MHGPAVTWGVAEHLLAAVIDVLQIGNWQYASAHSKSKVKQPKPIERPGADPRIGSGKGYTPAELKRRLAESTGPLSPYREVASTTV